MKAIKIIGVVIILIIALVIGVGVFLAKNINSLVKESVEFYGPQVTHTDVQLNSVDISLKNASASLGGFAVANPSGFTGPQLFSFDQILVDLDPSKIKDKVVLFENIGISGININVQEKALKTNIEAMIANLTAGSKPAEQAPANAKPIDLKFAIKNLVFNEGKVNLKTEKYGDYNLTLPSFTLNNIGDPNKGLSPEALGTAIIKPLLRQVEEAAKNRLEDIAKDKAKEKLKSKLQDKLDGKLSKEKQDELKNKLDGVKNLFGR